MIKKLVLALFASLLAMPMYAQTPRNIATAPIGFYVDNNGNDANDGLSYATAKQHYCVMLKETYTKWDFQWNQPYMFVTSGQLFNEMCGAGGTFVGADAIIIAPYDPAHPSSPGNIVPSPDFIRTCLPPVCGSTTPAVQWCDSFGDLAIQIYYNVTWSQCNHWNMVGGAAIVLHNVATTDIFGSRSTFSGVGNNDTAILADGPAIITIANAPLINGTFGYPIQCNRQCNATISGPFEANYANIKGFYFFGAGSNVNLGVSNYPITASIVGPSVVTGFATVDDHGTAIAGGVLTPNNGLVCHDTPQPNC